MTSLQQTDAPSATPEWTVIRPACLDVTGDLLPDECVDRRLTLVDKILREDADDYERPSLIYMNDPGDIKLVATPYWAAGVGETYTITVYQKTL